MLNRILKIIFFMVEMDLIWCVIYLEIVKIKFEKKNNENMFEL